MKDFTVTVALEKPAGDVFKALTDDVAKWWGGNDLSGSTAKLNDEFVIHHPGAHYSKQKVTEMVPGKKVVWHITESTLYWLQKDKHEWAGTTLIFEITPKGDKSELRFTHEGLNPEKECYEKCANEGWAVVIKEWLFRFINNGEAHFS